jgi:hypothetical protein
MRQLTRVLFVLGVSLCGQAGAQAVSPAAASGLKPGMWEIVTHVESSDTTTTRTITSRVCYSPEDVASPTRVLPPQRGLGAQCLASDIKAGGQSGISWKLACKGKDAPLNGEGTLKPGPTSYTAEIRLERKAGAKVVKVGEKTTGKWLGECK